MSSNLVAQTLLHYLAKTRQSQLKKEFARRQLEKHISTLKRTTPSSVRKQIEELERKIQETIKTEQGILQDKQKDTLFHERLRSKIKQLEDKLKLYEESQTKRLQKAKTTEKRISLNEKKRLLKEIEQSLKVVEKVVASMNDSGKYPAKVVRNIQAHVKGIKKRVENIKRRLS